MAFTAIALACICLNVAAGVVIVFANKAVFAVYQFHFPLCLTLMHLIFTSVGMRMLAQAGLFSIKGLPIRKVLDLSAVYVLYIVMGNLSLQLNSVGFYQITKILIGPTVLVVQSTVNRKLPGIRVVLSVSMLSIGIAVATVSDSQVMSNTMGILVGLLSVLVTAVYNIWAGSKQAALEASSFQLVQQFSPYAAGMLAVLVLLLEPTGWRTATPDTIMGFQFTWPGLTVMLLSSVTGLGVVLTTFLVIRHTSPLTYNVLGHIKTVCIVAGGYFFYDEAMPVKKLVGLAIAMCGIVWYSLLEMADKAKPKTEARVASRKPGGDLAAAGPLLFAEPTTLRPDSLPTEVITQPALFKPS